MNGWACQGMEEAARGNNGVLRRGLGNIHVGPLARQRRYVRACLSSSSLFPFLMLTNLHPAVVTGAWNPRPSCLDPLPLGVFHRIHREYVCSATIPECSGAPWW